jgi:hypothetical protein
MTVLEHTRAAPRPGVVLTPGDPGWDTARQAFNLLVHQHPAAIALPRDEDEVAAAVRYARSRGWRVVPQSTGHGAGPLRDALADAMIVHTSGLDSVRIDVSNRQVRVGSGVKWGRVAPTLAEHGLAALHGSSADVGIAGYSLGGGMGWLARRHGLQANAVTAVELVTADGHLVRADADHEPELFWALRGGGGNFGVVTALEFRVLPLPEVYAGAVFFPFDRSSEVLHTWSSLLPDLPDETMTWATLFHFPDVAEMPEPFRGGSFAVVMGAHLGPEPEGRDLLAPLHRLGPVVDTFATDSPAVLADLAMEDPAEPLPYLAAHQLLGDLPAEGVDRLLAAAGPRSGAGTSLDMVQLRHTGGALARAPQDAGARATLPGTVSLFSLGVVEEEPEVAPVRAALDAVQSAAAPYRVGDYSNFVETPADARTFFDPGTWRRLTRVKELYDPEDVFRGNHHVPPGRGGAGA